MNFYFRPLVTLMLAAVMAASLGACSSSSSPTAGDGIDSLKGIDGAIDESGDEGIHPDTWEGDHRDLPQADLTGCISCHADTSVDEKGCLPCHNPNGNVEEEDEGDEEGSHPDGWEDDHQTLPPSELDGCMGCHIDTSVDEQGCLPCHTGSGDEDEGEEEDDEEEDEGGEEDD